MHYEGTVIRPPSEADAIILQITVGCSHNHCTFCGAYKDVTFRVKNHSVIDRDIEFASKYCKRQSKVFLADGDVLILPQTRLEELFIQIRRKLPQVNRISLYATPRAARQKNIDELTRLKKLGLSRVYMGLESGDDSILTRIKKGETSQSMIEAGKKIIDAGLFLSTTVILGISGKGKSHDHAYKTALLCNEIKPSQLAALTLMPLANTEIGNMVEKGDFHISSPGDVLFELKTLLENLTLKKSLFMANHASNHLPLSGRLSRDKSKLLSLIDDGLSGRFPLVSDSCRML